MYRWKSRLLRTANTTADVEPFALYIKLHEIKHVRCTLEIHNEPTKKGYTETTAMYVD